MRVKYDKKKCNLNKSTKILPNGAKCKNFPASNGCNNYLYQHATEDGNFEYFYCRNNKPFNKEKSCSKRSTYRKRYGKCTNRKTTYDYDGRVEKWGEIDDFQLKRYKNTQNKPNYVQNDFFNDEYDAQHPDYFTVNSREINKLRKIDLNKDLRIEGKTKKEHEQLINTRNRKLQHEIDFLTDQQKLNQSKLKQPEFRSTKDVLMNNTNFLEKRIKTLKKDQQKPYLNGGYFKKFFNKNRKTKRKTKKKIKRKRT